MKQNSITLGSTGEIATRSDAEIAAEPIRLRLHVGKETLRTLPNPKSKGRPECGIKQYEDMVVAQNGRCAICHTPTFRLVIDHDHATGLLRELLCHRCNSGIGMLGDSPLILESALAYLLKHRQPQTP